MKILSVYLEIHENPKRCFAISRLERPGFALENHLENHSERMGLGGSDRVSSVRMSENPVYFQRILKSLLADRNATVRLAAKCALRSLRSRNCS